MLQEIKELWPVLRPVLKRKRVWVAGLALCSGVASLLGYQVDLGPLADLGHELMIAILGG